ncbi:tyrosine aminotransferase [Drosophila sulfurigaster albostrigata]|uniref:tyrosine aminotransferase n=1 Tax=Drosophila sulfurigaster albostrigata TaxID=89887 RepID=UPI002D21D945|nr:tyrosine aminotransferase [Drosophila sulfurigaster albostrigata]
MPSSVANEGYKYQSSIGSRNTSSGSPPVVVPNVDVDVVDKSIAQLQLDTHRAHNQDAVVVTNKLRSAWKVKGSSLSLNTHNRIRNIVEALKIKPNPLKPMIPLSIGDPTIFGNLKAADETMKAVLKSVESGKFNGYAHTQGHEASRVAVAKYSAHQRIDGDIDPNDVVLCSGCSAALEYCILALADRGQNVLVPRPGFCLYHTLTEGLGIEVRYYDLLPELEWRADLKQLESLIDENTAALLINNPSNPCGSVFDKEHLMQLVDICERHYLPIIADEIYEHFVFPGSHHVAVSNLTREVPVLSCGGLTKRFLVPGWRMGWIIVHDQHKRLGNALTGLKNMCGRILGSNTIIQGALPDILTKTPQSYFDGVIDVLYSNAQLAYKLLKQVRGINPIMPNGAMYMMIGVCIERFPEFKDDTHFVQELVNEQSVFCLPGSCFEYPGYVRIVLTVPSTMIEEACVRIAEFCEAHFKKESRALIEHNLLDDAHVDY